MKNYKKPCYVTIKKKRFDSEIMLVLKPEDETVDMIEYEAKMIGKKNS